VFDRAPDQCSLTVCGEPEPAPAAAPPGDSLLFVSDVSGLLRQRFPGAFDAGFLDSRVFAQSRDAIEGLALLAPGIASATVLAQQVLAQPGVTCCIACSDLEAMVLLDECTRRGISVPGRLSVCAFDDSVAATVWSLTSYNFNDEAVMAAMVDHILGGKRYRSAATGRSIAIAGHVRERRSSGAPTGRTR
jgi:hypothetical protein